MTKGEVLEVGKKILSPHQHKYIKDIDLRTYMYCRIAVMFTEKPRNVNPIAHIICNLIMLLRWCSRQGLGMLNIGDGTQRYFSLFAGMGNVQASILSCLVKDAFSADLSSNSNGKSLFLDSWIKPLALPVFKLPLKSGRYK